ncbi:CheW domain protein [Teredinibacter turnerae T7901]|uniref:CheW domain protein n=1 Tax=Teredinibacter turnerae (strain ATCC 39867 / T7901) TaxID=377629 RepID=C5BSI3_TERTT|nr:chemotaxis protein CheW [Teredinibacter turnerae]ACR12570.1 CheW domain protein [Teredinibacter turnerae T7901]
MDKHSAQDSLLSYFDELLGDLQPEPIQVAAPVPTPALKPEPAPAPVVQQTTQTLDQRELEASKRLQLQALLNQQITPVPAPAPKTVTEPKTVTAPAAVPPPAVQTQSAVQTREVAVSPIAVEKAETHAPAKVIAPAPKIEAKAPVEAVQVAEVAEQDAHTLDNPLLHWAENGRPQWAQSRFEVLLFNVSGLTLAVPLIALGQIQTIGDQLTPIFGQSDWFMGLLNSPMGQIKTLNTALFVMPEKYSPKFLETAKYVISIDGLNWGLAVDAVNQPITLEPSDVKWRSQRTSRPWLAGTVKSAMCALIDIPRMATLLMATERRR